MTVTREDANYGSDQTLATGAAAAATAAAPQVFAQQVDQGGAFKFYEKGNVRIRYQEIGSGFPLLAPRAVA